jgi:hypothetical protein
MRVLTFSREFPAYHPKAGQPTHFVEQIWNGITHLGLKHLRNKDLPDDFLWSILPLSNYGCKFHTIRSGNRWKVGDKFSPRVWGTDINPKSGRSGAYHSKQIIIAPDIEIKKVWDFEIKTDVRIYTPFINGDNVNQDKMEVVAINDGLTLADFYNWFPKNSGKMQIICWNSEVVY